MELSEFNAFSACPDDDITPGSAARASNSSEFERAIRSMITAAGDNPDREGLKDTPARVARAWAEWFSGYQVDPKSLLSRGL